jgi:hypothetical protein
MIDPGAQKLNLSVVIPLKEVSNTVVALAEIITGVGCQLVIVQSEEVSSAERPQRLIEDLHSLGADVCRSPPSRGGQIARGVAETGADWIWVLHGDSSQVEAALGFLADLSHSPVPVWGRFDVNLSGANPALALIGFLMNLRSRWTGICTGDQGMFFHRSLLEGIGGFPDQRLMEDIEVSRRLRGTGVFHASKIRITTSGERWMRGGLMRTVVQMWRWRLRYFMGVSADELYAEYYPSEGKDPR